MSSLQLDFIIAIIEVGSKSSDEERGSWSLVNERRHQSTALSSRKNLLPTAKVRQKPNSLEECLL